MSWGTLGTELTLEGASSRSWTLRFERRLAPREGSATSNTASSVWLVRDAGSSRLYAAKRQNLAAAGEVDALVDEAAAWRAACLADSAAVIPELVDVFVTRTPPLSVTFLAEFCARGLIPRSPPLSEPVLLTIAADLATAANALPSPHGHIAYESLLVDEGGHVRLAGFGAHRSAILRDNPGLAKQDDAFDIGMMLYEFVFGRPPPDSLEIPESAAYSRKLTDIIAAALAHALPVELRDMALAAGAEPRAPVVDVEKTDEPEKELPVHVSRATERNVDRLVTGVDIATSFSALLGDLCAQPDAVASAVFRTLFKKPVSKDPICAMRVLTMLHNLMIDGPDTMLAAVRKNDKFMDWAESSWTREAIESAKDPDDTHQATHCFAGGELAFYSSMLRRKARFHMLAAGGFSGRWDRTGAVNSDGRDVLVTRRRKVVAGMADVMEMASELGCRLAAAQDDEAPVKHAALGAIVSDCCLSFGAALALSHEVETARDAEKLVEGIGRLYHAARAIVFAVEHVPAAGGEQWVEQFANESPPDIVAEAGLRERNATGVDETGDIPADGWTQTEKLVEDEEKAERKRKKAEKKKRKEEAEAKAREAEQEKKEKEESAKEEITASDGALVVHGAGDAAAAAVATMFGDLLAIDDGANKHASIPEPAPRPLPNMSNAQALASAFGVPEEVVVDENVGFPPPEHDGDDDEDGGGYADFQARQEEQQTRRNHERQVASTAAWAARSGRSGGAMVVSGGSSVKKSHPVFCQCAICQQEEAQAAAEEAHAAVRNEYDHEATPFSGSRFGENGDAPNQRRGGYGHGEDEVSSSNRRASQSYYEEDRRDSIDDDDDQPRYAAPSGVQGGNRKEANSYYQDDYDSYESVTYSVDEDKPQNYSQNIPEAAPAVLVPPPPRMEPAQKESFSVSANLALNMKKLRMGDKISDNHSVTVYKGEYNRETVAIKKLAKGAIQSSATVNEFKNEVKLMCTMSHPSLLRCIAASLQKPNYIFVTEFMKRGTLFDVLHKSRIKLTWALIRKVALQVAEGMRYMHEHGILHRDLKSLNIFVDGSYNVKIGDFGFSRHVSESQGSGITGTYPYMAPEILRGEPHTEKSDVFAYAQVLCEIVSGTPPFHGMEAKQVAERVVNEDIRPPIPMHCQRAYVNLIQICWGTAPSTRPSFAEIVELIQSTTK